MSCSTPCTTAVPLAIAKLRNGWMYCLNSFMSSALSCAKLGQLTNALRLAGIE